MGREGALSRTRKKTTRVIKVSPEEYSLEPVKYKGLVLSGGGAKGIAYAGLIKKLEENGSLEALTHLSGASAGALTATLVSMGFDSKDIFLIFNGVNFPELIGLNHRRGIFLSNGRRMQNALEFLCLFQLSRLFDKVEVTPELRASDDYQEIQDRLIPYKRVLSTLNLEHLDSTEDAIKLCNDIDAIKAIDYCFRFAFDKKTDIDAGKKSFHRINFSDLSRIRALLPEDQAKKIKKLSVVVTNQSQLSLETYNETTHPEASITRKAKQSAAHPFLFSSLFSENGDKLIDGGLLDNLPYKALLDLGLDIEEILNVVLLSQAEYDHHINQVKANEVSIRGFWSKCQDILFKKVFGVNYNQILTGQINAEKILYQLGNIIHLNTGSITLTDTSPSSEAKREAIEYAYDATEQHFRQRDKSFKHPLLAMMHLTPKVLMSIIEHENEDYIHAKLAHMIQSGQKMIYEAFEQHKYDDVFTTLREIEEAIEEAPGLSCIQKVEALGEILRQINFMTYGQLETYLNQEKFKKENPYRNVFEYWWVCLKNSINQLIGKVLSLWESAKSKFLNIGGPVSTGEPTVDSNSKLLESADFDEESRRLVGLYQFFGKKDTPAEQCPYKSSESYTDSPVTSS